MDDSEQPTNKRNPADHLTPYQFKPGVSGNPGGRPKGGLKDYDRKKFVEWSDEEKEKFLSTIAPELRYKMAEGNPAISTDIAIDGSVTIQVVGFDGDIIHGNQNTP